MGSHGDMNFGVTWLRFGRQHTRCVLKMDSGFSNTLREMTIATQRKSVFLKSGPCSMQAVVCNCFLCHMAAFLAITHKVCVEDGLRIPEDSRRDDECYPKTIHLFILKFAP